MSFTPFYNKFPEIAEDETRSITIFNDPKLSDDSFGLIESYCDETDCDCRRVFLNIHSEKQDKILAVITFGWESEKFYANWLGTNEPQIIKELKGPTLNLASPQSKLAPKILNLVHRLVLHDKKYIERLKRHYELFREDIKNRHSDEINENSNIMSFPSKVGRNMPCPCGSGKKYKKCCLK
jgi:hypothetical protein